VYKTIKLGPVKRQVFEQVFNLGVVPDIAVKNQLGVKVRRKFSDSVFETFSHVAKSQFGTLYMARFGNAIGNRSAGQNPRDKDFFTL